MLHACKRIMRNKNKQIMMYKYKLIQSYDYKPYFYDVRINESLALDAATPFWRGR